jgi:PAS domain S-box-containing protein
MEYIITLIGNPFSLQLPHSITGWGLIGFYLVVIYWRLRYWHEKTPKKNQGNSVLLALLIILVPFTSLFIALRLNSLEEVQNSLYVGASATLLIPLFGAIPWILAGGLMPPIYAVISAWVSGLMISFFTQHSLLIPFEYSIVALVYCELIRMRYRGWVYRLLRNPLIAALVSAAFLMVTSIGDYSIGEPGMLSGQLGGRLLTLAGAFILLILPNIIAGIVGYFLSNYYQASWVKPGPLFPATDENVLTRRFFTGVGPFVFFLFFALLVGTWLVSGAAARKLVQARLAGTAEVAADGIPFFINTGNDLLTQYSHALPLNGDTTKDIQISLAQSIRTIQFFKQLAFVDKDGKILVSYPESSIAQLSLEEIGIVQQTVTGGILNSYTAFSTAGSNAVTISFAVPVKDDLGRLRGVLVGRSDLATNPYTQSTIYLLNNMSQKGGEGYIIDENGKVIYHQNVEYLNSIYPGELSKVERFYTLTTAGNNQLLIYYKPSKNLDWSVVLAVPSAAVQAATWEVTLPMFAILFLAAVLLFLIFKAGLSSITYSIKVLTNEADRISKGTMDHTQYIRGDDEIGQLGQMFEQMRLTLKDRIDELNLLLSVSQGIATHLDLESALQPILEAAISNGGSMARIVLIPEPDTDPYSNTPTSFGLGETLKYYTYLDEQVMALTRSRDVISLNNLIRGRVLKLNPELLNPAAIISVPIRNNNRFLGILWTAYDQPRSFPDSEVKFLSTLASDVSLAVTNIRLYKSAELGKKRLIAILESTPDPIFVIDQDETIILANNPARELFKMNELFIEGKKIQDVISNQELLSLLRSGANNREVRLDQQRVFYASIADMVVETTQLGKVCILRDITHFKEVDSLKSEFVATVSHDLRTPLTLMRGNATMLQMVGELNEQQKNYIKKITTGIESMSRLVNNLLDLGRIEAGIGLQLEPVHAKEVVQKVETTLQLQAVQKNITVLNEIAEESDPMVNADSALLQQALYNLVENGIKYSPVGGQVNINCSEYSESVVFEVKDNGKGIAPLDIPRLFEKFFRSSQREGYVQKPSSMGLAIVKSIAERHGGKLWVDSQLGKGSTFFLQIPAVVDIERIKEAPMKEQPTTQSE